MYRHSQNWAYGSASSSRTPIVQTGFEKGKGCRKSPRDELSVFHRESLKEGLAMVAKAYSLNHYSDSNLRNKDNMPVECPFLFYG